MTNTALVKITVSTTINAPVEQVWEKWTQPEDIKQWCAASDDWHAPHAENDVRNGGKFKTVMAAKDGSFSFDFEGVYDHIDLHKQMDYTLLDNRKVSISFDGKDSTTTVTETFEAEDTNPIEMQQAGWQAILDNFRKYAESK